MRLKADLFYCMFNLSWILAVQLYWHSITDAAITVLINGLVSLQGVCLNRLSVRCPMLAGVMCSALEYCRLPPVLVAQQTARSICKHVEPKFAGLRCRTNKPYRSKGTDGSVYTCLQASQPFESSIFVSVLESCLPLHIFFFLFVFLKCTLEYVMLWLHFLFSPSHITQEPHCTYPRVQSECFQLWLALKEDEILLVL